MAGRTCSGSIRLIAAVAAGSLLLSGCQLVTRVVSLGDASPEATVGNPITGCATLRLAPDDSGTVSQATLDTTQLIVTARLTSLGVTDAAVDATPPDQLTVGLPIGDDSAWRAAITRPGRVAFVPVPAEFNYVIVDGQPLPDGIDPTPLFGSEGVATATLSADEMGRPAISLTLTPDAATAFDDFAAAHFGERFAIVVDGIVASAPSINARQFDGKAQISGSFTAEEAASLVTAIASGPLPVAVIEERWAPAVDGTCGA